MAEATFTVIDPSGLHARPAARFVQVASRFAARVTVRTDTAEADAKSLIAILGLAVRPGSGIRLIADGPDQADALAALSAELMAYVVPLESGDDAHDDGRPRPVAHSNDSDPG